MFDGLSRAGWAGSCPPQTMVETAATLPPVGVVLHIEISPPNEKRTSPFRWQMTLSRLARSISSCHEAEAVSSRMCWRGIVRRRPREARDAGSIAWATKRYSCRQAPPLTPASCRCTLYAQPELGSLLRESGTGGRIIDSHGENSSTSSDPDCKASMVPHRFRGPRAEGRSCGSNANVPHRRKPG
jgi:hypothetical protein